jgi:hypothetical protein
LSVLSSNEADPKEPITLDRIASAFSKSISSQGGRANRFVEKAPDEEGHGGSIEKYRYNWRVQEVVEGRETSITPLKK